MNHICLYSYILLIAKYIYKIKIVQFAHIRTILQLNDCSSKLSVSIYIVILIIHAEL